MIFLERKEALHVSSSIVALMLPSGSGYNGSFDLFFLFLLRVLAISLGYKTKG